MPDSLNVLLVDDDADNREYLGVLLQAIGYAPEAVGDGSAALERLARDSPPDVVILDVVMPGIDGLETLRRYRAAGGRVPVIMCSALDESDMVVRCMRAGASDYITKPFNTDELREVLERVTADGARPRALSVAPAPPAPAKGAGLGSRLGVSAAMRRVDELIGRIADADVPVLITGESGVGKDVVAREIHARSNRAGKVFVKINCAALPGELLESELFGHERGSFTGAQRTKPGQFELADGGTLFLDEIGEMPVALQAKLLQALQDGEFYRVGGQKKIKVDARVIVATNVDLGKAMAAGTFREDLYYRLNVVQVSIPPLRERREDIPRLLDHFVEKYGKRYGRTLAELPGDLIDRFLRYDYPGNIRELENLVRRLMVLRDSRYVLEELDRGGLRAAAATSPTGATTPLPATPPPAVAPAAPSTTNAPPVVAAVGAPVPLPVIPPPPLAPAVVGYTGSSAALLSPFNSPSPLPPPTIPPPPLFRTAASIADAAGAEVAAQAALEDDYRIDLKELGKKAAHAAEREAIIIMLGHTGGNKRDAAARLGISYKAILYKIREFGIGRPRTVRPRPATGSASAPAATTSEADAHAAAEAPAVVVEPTPDVWTADESA
jgi:DNA-binding NtrC family response regulator